VTWLQSLRGGVESRASVEDPTYPLTSATLVDFLSGPALASGVTVSDTGSLAMSAVYRSVALISGVSAALPLHVFRTGTRDRMRSPLLENPHPDLTPLELWRLTYVHRCLWGNAYLQKVRDSVGRTQWLYPITPSRVRVGKARPTAANPSGKVFEVENDDGAREVLTSTDIFHLPAMGYDGVCGVSPVRLARQGIGLGLAAEEYGARLFGSGSLMSGILQTEQRLDQAKAEQLSARWEAKVAGLARSHKTALLDSGTKFQPLTMPNTDAQFLESRNFQTADVARFFGVPAFLMGLTEKATSWGTGLEQQATGWVTFDLHPQWLAPTEQRITKELTGSGVDAKYKVQGLLRGDSAARAEFYRVMREVGAMSANDIRDLEDMPPIDHGDTYLQPLNMAPLGSEGTPAGSSDDTND
jgi:HK97 family phage portal protein